MDEQSDRQPTEPEPSIRGDISLSHHEKTANQKSRGIDRLCAPQRISETRGSLTLPTNLRRDAGRPYGSVVEPRHLNRFCGTGNANVSNVLEPYPRAGL